MSLQDDLTAVRRCLDELVRTVGQLERSVARLREAPSAPPPRDDLVTIPDAPYDSSLWTAAGHCDDEGLGVRDRHAP